MKFVADESVPQPVISRLRKDGHEILAVVELKPGITMQPEASRVGSSG